MKKKSKRKKNIKRPGRRTKDEISIGMTIEEKKAGMSYDEKLEGKKISEVRKEKNVKKRKKRSSKSPLDPNSGSKSKSRKDITNVFLEGRKAQEVLNEELGNCSWEWKYIEINDKFKLTQLNKLGKQNWKFAFLYEPKVVNKDSKRLPVICLQRPINRKGK